MYKSTIFNLTGKTAIVTGGLGYLGKSFVNILSKAGANVVIASRNVKKHDDHLHSMGKNTIAISFDLTNEKSIANLVKLTVKQFGNIDILINNAINITVPSINEATKDDFFLAFDTSVYAYFALSREAYRYMVKNNGGSIINIASMYGIVASYPSVYEGLPFKSPATYHAAKGGLIQLTRHLAAYWAKDNVRVNCISPGAFPNVGEGEDWDEFVKRLNSKIPLGRVGTPDELEGMILLLASKAGSYITGQNIVIDGGWTCW